MIAKISGILAGLSRRGALIEVGGLTYEVYLTALAMEKFRGRRAGEKVSLYTLYYLENGSAGGWLVPILVGFEREEEREFFRLFTSVENIGVKTALAAMTLPVREIARAIERSDVETLKKLKGVGERTARKIIAALSGRVTAFTGGAFPQSGEREESPGAAAGSLPVFLEDALQVLLQLGYSPAEARKMVREAFARNSFVRSAEDLLEEIYKSGTGMTAPPKR